MTQVRCITIKVVHANVSYKFKIKRRLEYFIKLQEFFEEFVQLYFKFIASD